jgi:hypothetical protein
MPETPDGPRPEDPNRSAGGVPERGTEPVGEAAAETGQLPEQVIEQAERLTRLARRSETAAERATHERERADILAEYGFTARVRATDDTLVLHPSEWVVDGAVEPTAVENVDRGVEVSLSGPGESTTWPSVERHNAAIVERVRERAVEASDIHARNARALADFAGNQYAKQIERLTESECREFLEEYFPRNAWPDERQRSLIGRSLELAFAVTDVAPPTGGSTEDG